MRRQMFGVIILVSIAEVLSEDDNEHSAKWPVNHPPIYFFKPEPIYKKVDFRGHSEHNLIRGFKSDLASTDYSYWPIESEMKPLKQRKRDLLWSPKDFHSAFKQSRDESGNYFAFPRDLIYKPKREPVVDPNHDQMLVSYLPFGNKHVFPKYTYGPFVYRFLRFPSVLHKLFKYKNYKKKSNGHFKPLVAFHPNKNM